MLQKILSSLNFSFTLRASFSDSSGSSISGISTNRSVGHFQFENIVMLNTRKLAPGQKGTKKLHEQFGDRLLCVRYRYDDQLRKRFKTVELIVEEAAWTPPATLLAANAIVGVRVGLTEVELQRKVKQAGGKWNPARRLWEIHYDRAVKLGLKGRIEKSKVSDDTNR